MANLTNINNKFLVTTTGEVLVNQTAAVGTSKFQVTGDVTINNASNALLTLSAGSLDSARIEYLENGVAKVALRNSVGAGPFDDFGIFAGSATPIWNNNNLRITVKGATGNVGIGTDAPAYKLQVSGAQNANDIVINNTTTGVNLRLQMIDANGSIFTTGTKDLTLGTNNTERIRINQSGNVGIGDLSPGFKLNVTKGYTSGFAKVAKFRSGNDATFVNFDTVQVVQTDVPCLAIIETSTGTQSNEQKLTFSAGDNKAIIGSTSTVTNGMSFYTNRPVTATGFAAQGNLALHLANTGNVGIGTTSPSEKLDVRGGNIMVGGFGGGTDYGLILTPDDGSGYWNIANVTGGALTFNNSNTIGSSEAMRITGGKVGIGTTSPGAKLEIFGTGNTLRLDSAANQSKTILLRNVGSGTAEIKTDGDLKLNAEDSGKTIQFFTEDTERMRITSAGNVAIGSTSADGKLDITQSSATDPVLRLTDDGVANYDFIFPDTSTIKLETNTTSNKTFKLLNAGSGNFNFEASDATFAGNATIDGALSLGKSSTAYRIDMETLSGGNAFRTTRGTSSFRIFQQNNGASFMGTENNADLNIQTNATTRLTIEADGDVLLTEGNFTMSGATPFIVLSNTAETESGITFVDSADPGQSAKITYDASGNDFKFYNNSTNVRMVIDSSGRVGIGTTSPSRKLDVNGDAQVDFLFQRENSGTATTLSTPRILDIPYQGTNGTFSFNPVELFGCSFTGGQVELQVTGWRMALNNGFIYWRDNGSNTTISNGQVEFEQTAYVVGAQTGSNTISVSCTSGNIIIITFAGWHTNGHGWQAKIISDM